MHAQGAPEGAGGVTGTLATHPPGRAGAGTPGGMSTDAASVARRPRTGWIDGARGIGIILVVFAHALRALHPQVATAPAWVQASDRAIYSFHMPLFFLLSGLFAWRSLAAGRGRFAADKLVTIAYPYFLWSLVEGGIELLFARDANTPLDPTDMLLIPVAPIEQFWFLYALFLCQLMLLACYPSRAVLVAVACVGVIAATMLGTGPMPLRALAFLPYVALGVVCAPALLRLGSSRAAGAALLGASAVAWAGLLHVTSRSIPLPVSLVIGTAGSFMTIGTATLVVESAVGPLLELLGRTSMAIYVMHTIFSAGMRIVPTLVGLSFDFGAMLAMTTLAGIAGPLAVWWIAERFGVAALLGIGPRRRLRPAVADGAGGRLP